MAHFEELQVIKFVWTYNIANLATQNSSQVEEIEDKMEGYQDLLAADGEQASWDDVDAITIHSV